MLLNLEEILSVAKENSFAVGAFNTTDVALVRAVVEEAEKLILLSFFNLLLVNLNTRRRIFEYVIKRVENSKVLLLCISITVKQLKIVLWQLRQDLHRLCLMI